MKICERERYLFSLSKEVCERKLFILFAAVFIGYQYICYASVSALQHRCKVVDVGWCMRASGKVSPTVVCVLLFPISTMISQEDL